MAEASNDKQQIIDAYRRRAPSYDLVVRLFDIFAWLGFNISGWRKQAVSGLGLKAGDTVVDIGCGTGLNFPLLYRAVGPQGMIIGVDLSDAMLTQARHTAEANHWANVQLVCADASQFEFPPRVNAVLSTYTLTLVPGPERVVSNATAALAPGGRLVVLDMAWPRYCPPWWRHVLFFLRSYGVTAEVLRRRPWEAVQKAMEERLRGVSRRQFWFGFFYLASGAAPDPMDQPKGRADDDPSETIIAMERAALDRWGRGDPSGFLEISAPDVVYFDPSLERRIDGRAALSRYYEALRGKVSISRYELINLGSSASGTRRTNVQLRLVRRHRGRVSLELHGGVPSLQRPVGDHPDALVVYKSRENIDLDGASDRRRLTSSTELLQPRPPSLALPP